MKKSKRLLALLLVLTLCLAVLPVSAAADETSSDAVAQIGETTYATLDEAVTAAADGDTITVLANCDTAGLNLSKDLTIKGASGVNPTITFNTYGMALWANVDLVFEDCTVKMNNITSTPYTGEWNWMAICASSGVTLTLNNVEMDIVCTESNTAHCIYFCKNNKLNLNNSKLLIQGYQQDALEWDGGDGGYNVNITNSTYISESNRSGFTGTFYATIDNSTVEVNNSTGNGSNGTYYTIKNNSYVEFTGNRNWGISAYRIDMSDNSTLVACDNGYSGVWTRILNVDGTCTLDVERNGNHALSPTTTAGATTSTSAVTNAGIFLYGNGSNPSVIDSGADVTIKDNAGSGIYTAQGVAKLTINTDAVITNNGTGAVDTYNGYGATYGGGIMTAGTVVLCDDVIIYNNHASIAGDDIYSTKSITFGNVNSNTTWVLDDCDHVIDGWYEDGYETGTDEDGDTSEAQRWSANCENEGYTHIVLEESGTYTTTIAYKAAHGVDAKTKTSYPGLEKKIIVEDKAVDETSINAGDTVTFQLTSNVPEDLTNYLEPDDVEEPEIMTLALDDEKNSGTYGLIFHDVMDSALTLNKDSITVTINGVELASDLYTVTTSNKDGCTFEVSMDLVEIYDTVDDNGNRVYFDEEDFGTAPIIVTYNATANTTLEPGTYPNKAWVEYEGGQTVEDEVEVYTFGIKVFKYDQDGVVDEETGETVYTGLEGAIFTLYTNADCTETVKDSSGEVVTLTSDSDGYATYGGLAAGTYYLLETTAPSGYVASNTALEITVSKDAATDYVISAKFANAPIPSTGGMGTTLFTVGGLALILAAGVVFALSRKRRTA